MNGHLSAQLPPLLVEYADQLRGEVVGEKNRYFTGEKFQHSPDTTECRFHHLVWGGLQRFHEHFKTSHLLRGGT
ncbi:MAG: hypothetical protein WCV79_01755 [Candidatus Paceibacterota bacterium]|jgi:hypothetical protein